MDKSMSLFPPDPLIEAFKQDTDMTLLRANLRLTPTERLQKLMALQRFAEELRRAGREARAAQKELAALWAEEQ